MSKAVRPIFVFSFVVSLAALLLVWQAQAVLDWWFLRGYQPPQAIAQLARDSGFSEQGTRIFYLADPEIDDKETFRERCDFKEQTIVLGCYDGRRIYILDVDEPSLQGVEEVTAAHEMLHAAYDRLDEAERSRLEPLLLEAFEANAGDRLRKRIEAYRQRDPAVITNELHSIVPTELRNLPPELESYYARYFDDRLVVVALAEKYEAVFAEPEASIESYDARLSQLSADISSLESQAEALEAELQAERARLDALLAARDYRSYNAAVPGYNTLVNSYNSLIERLKLAIGEYNEIVALRNNSAVRQNELIQSIDRNYQPIEQE